MHDLKNLLKAFFFYGRGLSYIKMRYIVAPAILSYPHSLEKPKTREDLSMHMFFGKRDFLMGLWSLASFYRVMEERGEMVLHSDGTLGEEEKGIIARLFPSARIVDSKTFLKKYGHLLDAYPALKRFRETYKKFQIRIIDQHFSSDKPMRIFFDSDLLWFKEPKEMTEAIRAGLPRPLMMSNSTYIRMQFKDGTETDDETSRPNGGLVLYRKEQMDPKRLEAFLEKTDYIGKRFGDQAWVAWTLHPSLLPEDTYIIKGTLTDRIVMRHYTAPQRLKFFFYGLDRIYKSILK